jgi:acyl-homoserine lactone acylase PvdQ
VQARRLGYHESLDGFPALDPSQAVALPEVTVTDGGTIACQTSQSYTQWVPMHDPDLALSILPIGQSEWPGHPSRLSTFVMWGEGRLHPAPLSRERGEALGVTRTKLRLSSSSVCERTGPPATRSTEQPP